MDQEWQANLSMNQPQGQGQSQGQGQGQGQPPALHDALAYCKRVKAQYPDPSDVYNRFTSVLENYRSGAIDTNGVIGRVSQLFAGNPELIQGFGSFLPPGYRMGSGAGDDPNASHRQGGGPGERQREKVHRKVISWLENVVCEDEEPEEDKKAAAY